MTHQLGFYGTQQLANKRLTDVNYDTVLDYVRMNAQVHSEMVAGMMADIVSPVTVNQRLFELPGTGSLQPLDEWGNPLPVVDDVVYTVGFPLRGGGTANGTNRISRRKMTTDDVAMATLNAFTRDADWMMRHLLAAIFTNTSYTHTDDEGTVTVQPLANGDTVAYPLKSGQSATDTHYKAQAAGIADATNPYTDIHDELAEHPSNMVGENTPIIALIPRNLKAATQNLASFDRIASQIVTPGVQTAVPTAQASSIGAVGETVGVVGDNVIIRVWDRMPNDYIIAYAPAAGPFVGMRQHESTELQGLFMESHNVDGNSQVMRFLRFAGFGVMNRVAAVVYRIGNGSYAIPTGFTAPLGA